MTSCARRLRLGRAPRDESGFTLVEAVVALMISGIIFGALAASTMGALRTSMTARQDQQAADFMTRAVEQARAMGFGALGHRSADLTGDTRVHNCPAPSAGLKCVDPGTGTDEPLHLITTGAGVDPHVVTVDGAEANNSTFTVSSYVTEVSGQDASQVLRLTVMVDYQSGASPRSKSISTLIAKAQRGLPLPVYSLVSTTAPTHTVNPGGELVFGFKLVNQGAPDRFNLQLSGTASVWPWTLYEDVDADGTYDVATDLALTDTNGDGLLDTDRLDPASEISFLAVYPTTTATAVGTYALTLTSTSVAQPTADGAVKSLTVTPKVQVGAVTSTTTPPTSSTTSSPTTPATDCNTATATAISPVTGYTNRTMGLHNYTGSTTGYATDTVAQLTMTSTIGTYADSLFPYSQENSSALGRTLEPVASTLTDAQVLALTTPTNYADWRFATSGVGWVSTPAELLVWLGGPDGAALTSGSVRAVVYHRAVNGTLSVVNSGTATASPCTGFAKTFVTMTGAGIAKKFKNNEYFGVRLVNTGATELTVAYDTPVYPASLTVGVK